MRICKFCLLKIDVMHLSLCIFGLIIHLILLYSVFDIYYISPIVKNARSYIISADDGPAKRLVVFSAGDLMRSDIIIV
jgi:phosphatidylinositol glycan class N